MLKRVQHNDFVFNCRRGDCLESLALNVSTVDCYIIFNYSAIKPSHSARSSLSWICSTLGKFRFRHFVPVCSIPSLSRLTSCRPSANPLNPINASHWGSASLKQTFCTSYNNVDRGTWTPTDCSTWTWIMRVYQFRHIDTYLIFTLLARC